MCPCSKSAVGRRKSTRKATTTATKRRKRVSGTASGPAKTYTVAGIGVYKHLLCSKTKSGAASAAEKVRSTGKKARVVKSGTTYCVYTRGAANAAAKKRTTRKRA